jgi:hypothetical protein
MAGFGLLVALALIGGPHVPAAPWLHRVASVAGFRVAGHNDAAWFVEGRGQTGFYLWANRATPAREPVFDHLAGATLYGSRKQVGWRANGVTVWIQYGPRADATLPRRDRLAQLVLVTLRLPRRYGPIPMMPTPVGPLRKCRSSKLLAGVCPRAIPRVRGWRTYPSYGNPVTGTFGLESGGGEFPGKPELSRPPAMLHFELTAAHGPAARRVLPFEWPRGHAVHPRNGLVRMRRGQPVLLGGATWNGRSGSLVLAPSFPLGGSQGNHLIFRWRANGVTYFLGLHAWEPFVETVSTLRRMVLST